MNTFIALLRGINVGGNNSLPMRDLVKLLESLGLKNVKTYIQSGNVVFQSEGADSKRLSQEITAAIEKAHGFAPRVMLLDFTEFQNAAASNPFPEGESEPRTLHLFFMDTAPDKPDVETFENLRADSESFQIIDNVFYLHAPNGIGRSKLAESVEKALGVPTTARNWRTVSKVLDLARAVEAD